MNVNWELYPTAQVCSASIAIVLDYLQLRFCAFMRAGLHTALPKRMVSWVSFTNALPHRICLGKRKLIVTPLSTHTRTNSPTIYRRNAAQLIVPHLDSLVTCTCCTVDPARGRFLPHLTISVSHHGAVVRTHQPYPIPREVAGGASGFHFMRKPTQQGIVACANAVMYEVALR